jgi:hypothetical protein
MEDRLFPLDGLRSLFLAQGEIASPMPIGSVTKYIDIMIFFKINGAREGEFLSPRWRISS